MSRIPAIHDVQPDMTHFKSNARLLMPKPQNHIFSVHFRVMYSRHP